MNDTYRGRESKERYRKIVRCIERRVYVQTEGWREEGIEDKTKIKKNIKE